MPHFRFCQSLLLISALLLLCASPVFAEGIESAEGLDLPINGGGSKSIIVGGGDAVKSGDVEFLGSVGVGTAKPTQRLDVNGGVKVGYTTLCDATRIGTIRFNPSTLVFEGCDGSGWVSFSSKTETTIPVYRCPIGNTPGYAPGGGAWAYWGCQGQINAETTCNNLVYGWPADYRSCTYLGKMVLAP